MDDDSLTTKKPTGGNRHSLVERAAEKIATKARAQPEGIETSSVEFAPVLDASVASVGDSNDSIHLEQPNIPAREASEASPQGETSPLAPFEGIDDTKKQRRSPRVTIDIAGLISRGVLTPQTKRNRTVEEFRLIKRTVLSRRWDEGEAPGNTIVVTSAMPSEGKTTTALNLAMSIAAEEDVRVLLVDADFIKPNALHQLGVTASKGLIDVLQNPSMDVSDVILRTNIDKLSLIPAGQLHDRCTELLASARMDELISELAGRYQDRILIFDSPPLLVTTESVVLASHMGQVIFVVQAGRTKRETLVSALELIGEGSRVGLVLNRTTARLGNTDFGSYYGSYYGYGYEHKNAEAQTGSGG